MTVYVSEDGERAADDSPVFGVAIYQNTNQGGSKVNFSMVANVPDMYVAKRWLDGEPLDSLEHGIIGRGYTE